MDKIYTKPSEARASAGSKRKLTANRESELPLPRFFKAPEPPKPTPSEPLQLRLDADSILLLTAILNELKRRNDLEQEKMRSNEQTKQEESEALKRDKDEDEKRHKEVEQSLYM